MPPETSVLVADVRPSLRRHRPHLAALHPVARPAAHAHRPGAAPPDRDPESAPARIVLACASGMRFGSCSTGPPPPCYSSPSATMKRYTCSTSDSAAWSSACPPGCAPTCAPTTPTRSSSRTARPALAFPTTGGRSYTATLAIVDEADHTEDLDALLNAVKPTIDAGGRLILVSTVDKTRPGVRFQTHLPRRSRPRQRLPPRIPALVRPPRSHPGLVRGTATGRARPHRSRR